VFGSATAHREDRGGAHRQHDPQKTRAAGELGFIPPKAFTILVVMAITTTIKTGPILNVLLPRAGHALPPGAET
jgi:hypothetical protein